MLTINPYTIALMRVANDPSSSNLTEAFTALVNYSGTDEYEERRVRTAFNDRYGRRRWERYIDWCMTHPNNRFIRESYLHGFIAQTTRIVGEYVRMCDHQCWHFGCLSKMNALWPCVPHMSSSVICDECLAEHYVTCPSCDEFRQTSSMREVNGESYCGSCVRRKFVFCSHCEDYFLADEHDTNTCTCDAPHETFQFPNGTETIANDERLTVELPKGEISSEGIDNIVFLVAQELRVSSTEISKLVDEIGPQWQGRRGNFTKRLSSALYKNHQHKLSKWALSEVGNLAQLYSDNEATWNIEFTRRLNGTAAEFGNAGSCWWGRDSYGRSRCALKSWGGIGLRAFPSQGTFPGVAPGHPIGRAWVQPLDENLQPTHNVAKAHSFIIYNGYGNMQGYTPARIVAQMVGMTYRKVEFYAPGVYINNHAGYLVSNQEVCDDTDTVSFDEVSHHHRFDADHV